MMLGNNRWSMMPPVVKNLLIINGLMLLASYSFESALNVDLWKLLGLHYFDSELFRPYQFVTYMFMHGDLSHIFFNMFAVWMFGSAIENIWGSKRFLIYYLLTGFGAALIHYGITYLEIAPVIHQMQAIIDHPNAADVAQFFESTDGANIIASTKANSIEMYQATLSFYNNTFQELQVAPESQESLQRTSAYFFELSNYYKNLPNIVGASGALFGILLAFGMMFPNVRLFLIFFPVPIKAKYMMIGYGALELISAFQNNPNDNVAHFAHLGGMLFGFLIIKFWEKTGVRWR